MFKKGIKKILIATSFILINGCSFVGLTANVPSSIDDELSSSEDWQPVNSENVRAENG